jgi:hypothetical protein
MSKVQEDRRPLSLLVSLLLFFVPSPFLEGPKSIPVHGCIYDVAHGNLIEVEGARASGTSA